jgi:hypothetical protein
VVHVDREPFRELAGAKCTGQIIAEGRAVVSGRRSHFESRERDRQVLRCAPPLRAPSATWTRPPRGR